MKYVLDTHCHTTASGHAYSSITECADEAKRKGLSLIAITDHAQTMPGGAHSFYFMNLKSLPARISDVEILKGVELNILDKTGLIDLETEFLKRLDIGIASIHHPCFTDRKSTRLNSSH